jgi:hypothetical protein
MPTPTPLSYTLRIPDDLPQDIPSLEISLFPDNFEPVSPDVIGDIQPGQFTPFQRPYLGGAALPRLQWNVACKLPDAEAHQLAALYRWQQTRLAAKEDGRLLWTDRFEPTEPQPVGELLRDIEDAKTTAWGDTYGYPVVSCLISKPARQITGHQLKTDLPMWLCVFSVTEVWT